MASGSRLRRFLSGVAAAAVVLAPFAAQAQSLIRDTEIEAILRENADPLLRVAGLEPKDVEIWIVGDKEINAFAVAGQKIGLNTGLIVETETPNQLAGVIAHEACHIACGHHARSGTMMRAGLKPFLLTMGLGIAAALAGSGAGAAALIGSSGHFATLNILKYSRIQEGSADQAAATYLDKAGLSGRGLVEFYENFRYQEVFSEARRMAYFRSHPLSSDRINQLKVRVARSRHYDQVDSPEAMAKHAIMKAKLEAFLNPPAQTYIKYKEKDPSFPARYARAIAYYRASEPAHALRAIDALLAEQPNNPYLHELKGQVLFENGRVAESEGPHRRSVELKPDATLLRVNLGRTLVALEDSKRNEEAIAELNRVVQIEPDMYEAWRLLAQAYDRKGDGGRARLASAEAHYALGDKKQAKVFAMRAREQLDPGTPQRRRATDIVMASDPTEADLRDLAREEGRSLAVTRR
ncbi:MAG: M48 family metalloprotease [Pseudomonadota bacterium]|nr:M48 family metalloprotease [Pseudomonadota bacterium]